MKVYSDILTRAALVLNAPDDVYVHVEGIERPRVRSRGWVVALEGMNPERHKRAAGGDSQFQWESNVQRVKAATYDDHGVWMARLFDIDPDARISWWKNADHFHEGTEGKYRNPKGN